MLDLVGVSAAHRKLKREELQEVELGARIGTRRGLWWRRRRHPGAVQTLIACRRTDEGDFAAELILLPEGGVVKPST